MREDSEQVDRPANEIKKNGIRVWLDRDDIYPGIFWKDAIKRAIQQGELFIACFSESALKREKTYMREEINIAIDELRIRPIENAWFIPVILDESKLPSYRISSVWDLDDIQAIRLSDSWRDGI